MPAEKEGGGVKTGDGQEMGQAVSGMMGSSLTPSLLLLASNERLKHAMVQLVVVVVVFSSGPIQPLHVQKKG